MGWWYWFGTWLFGVTSIVMTWWLFLDASRRRGAAMRFIWPAVSLVGLLVQLPAFAMSKEQQSQPIGTTAAIAGVFGLLMVLIAAVTYFSKGSAGRSGWTLTTRDERSNSAISYDRRRNRVPGASVPIAPRRPSIERDPVAPPAKAASAGTVAPSAAPVGFDSTTTPAEAPAPSAGTIKSAPDESSAMTSDAGETIIDGDQPTVTDGELPTVVDGPGLTVIDAVDTVAEEGETATIVDEPASTVIDEPQVAPTILDEPEPMPTIIEDPAALKPTPEIVLVDGRAQRIIVTERSGAFVVGRDPSKSNLAVEDARASRAHFSIAAIGETYYLTDLGSSNGTFVNGKLAAGPTPLAHGDTIEFGRTIANFKMP